jgi:integration host factor subunit beta
MKRSQLIARLAARSPHWIAKDAELVVKLILDAIATSLARGERSEFRGFGSFYLSYRPRRVGRNPKSGERVTIAARYVPRFKPAKDLRNRIGGARRKARVKD